MAVLIGCGTSSSTACLDSSSCSASQSCQGGVCVEGSCQDECELGQSLCLLGRAATCARQPNGCAQLSAPTECPAGLVCSGGICTDRCADQCTAGTKRCTGSKVQLCERKDSGCTDWSTPTACAMGAACSNNTCPGCTDSCVAGTSSCLSDSSQRSCQLGASGCLEWTTTSCGSGEMCIDQQCAPRTPCDPSCPMGLSCDFSGQCTGPLNALVLNQEGYAVSGSLTVNGATPNKDSAYCSQPSNANDLLAQISFIEPVKGHNATVSITCSTSGFNFSTTLPPGTYEVRVSPGTFATHAKVNLVSVNYLVKAGLAVRVPYRA